MEEVLDMYDLGMLHDQMPPWLATWVWDRDPKAPKDAMKAADQHL